MGRSKFAKYGAELEPTICRFLYIYEEVYIMTASVNVAIRTVVPIRVCRGISND